MKRKLVISVGWLMLLGVMLYPFIHILYIFSEAHRHHTAIQQNPGRLKGQRLFLEFSWQEYQKILVDKHEIKLEGQYYDIMELELMGGNRVCLTVVQDHYEVAILQAIIRFHHSRPQSDQQHTNLLIPDWITPGKPIIFNVTSEFEPLPSKYIYLPKSATLKDRLTPPPEDPQRHYIRM